MHPGTRRGARAGRAAVFVAEILGYNALGNLGAVFAFAVLAVQGGIGHEP